MPMYTWTYMCHNSSAYNAYVLWVELGHGHFCLGKCNVGGFMRRSIIKCSIHWKRALTCFNREVCTFVSVEHPDYSATT